MESCLQWLIFVLVRTELQYPTLKVFSHGGTDPCEHPRFRIGILIRGLNFAMLGLVFRISIDRSMSAVKDQVLVVMRSRGCNGFALGIR